MDVPPKHLYIYHHLGLGDHIICNGIVRNVYKKITTNITLFCKPKYLQSIQFMYRDLNIQIVPKDDHEVVNFLQPIDNSNKIFIGHHHLSKYINNSTFDQAFYKQVGLEFNKRWKDFYVQKDYTLENNLYNKIVTSSDYVFLHDDKTRNLNIDKNFIINKDLPIIEPNSSNTQNIFDYIKILENAKEIHCIDSCFRLLADSVLKENKDQKLFFHFNLKNNKIKDTTYAQSRLLWKIL